MLIARLIYWTHRYMPYQVPRKEAVNEKFWKEIFFQSRIFRKIWNAICHKKAHILQQSYSISVTKQGREVADGAIVEEDTWRETSGSLKHIYFFRDNTFFGELQKKPRMDNKVQRNFLYPGQRQRQRQISNEGSWSFLLCSFVL